MGSIRYIKSQDVYTTAEAAALPSPNAGDVKLYRRDNGLWYEKDSTGAERVVNWGSLIVPPYTDYGAATVDNQAGANSFTNVVTHTFSLPVAGDYKLSVNFSYNCDSNTSNIHARATWDTNAIDANLIGGGANNFIMSQELKDNATITGGNVPGTASGSMYAFSHTYLLSAQTAGNHDFVLDVGAEAANVEASMWNIFIQPEIITIA